jgi:arsenate reductase-like glutaredoxin family protein
MYKLYVIPGSHACRSAILMLEHKQVPYRRVALVTSCIRWRSGCAGSTRARKRA